MKRPTTADDYRKHFSRMCERHPAGAAKLDSLVSEVGSGKNGDPVILELNTGVHEDKELKALVSDTISRKGAELSHSASIWYENHGQDVLIIANNEHGINTGRNTLKQRRTSEQAIRKTTVEVA